MGALDPVREPWGPAGPRGPLVPVRLDLWSQLVGRTGTNGPRSWPTTIGPGWWLEPGPMSLAPGPPPLVPVGGSNRDQRLNNAEFFYFLLRYVLIYFLL